MAGNNGNGSGGDNGLIIFLVVLIAGPLLAWFFLQKPVVFLWSWISYGQIWLLAHYNAWTSGRTVSVELAANAPMMHWLLWGHAHPGKISWNDVAQVSATLGAYFRWLVIPIIALLAWINFQAVEKRKARQSLNDVVIAMQDRFPWGLPWLWQKSGLLCQTSRGPFRYALRPWEWIQALQGGSKRPLVCKERDDSPETIALLEPDRIRDALQKQLAHPLDDYEKWPVWLQALATACIPQARDGKDRETYQRLVRLARHYYKVQPKKQEYVPPELRAVPWPVDAADHAYLKQFGQHHGYRETLLMGLMAQARLKGLLPPVYFAWLRAVDRNLWYAAQSLGRPRSFIEGGGIMAHYQSERARAEQSVSAEEPDSIEHLYGDRGAALNTPQVDSAVAGLVFALREEDAGMARDAVSNISEMPAGWRS